MPTRLTDDLDTYAAQRDGERQAVQERIEELTAGALDGMRARLLAEAETEEFKQVVEAWVQEGRRERPR